MRKILFLAVYLCMPLAVCAQADTLGYERDITLDEAIALARVQSVDAAVALNELKTAALAKVNELKEALEKVIELERRNDQLVRDLEQKDGEYRKRLKSQVAAARKEFEAKEREEKKKQLITSVPEGSQAILKALENHYEEELARQLDDFVEEKHYHDKVILTKDFFVDIKNGLVAFKYSDVKWIHIHSLKYYGVFNVSSSIIVHLKDGKTNLQCVEIKGKETEEFMDIFHKLCEKAPEDALRGYTQENIKAYKEYKKSLKNNNKGDKNEE